jgi:hypothetical protein
MGGFKMFDEEESCIRSDEIREINREFRRRREEKMREED